MPCLYFICNFPARILGFGQQKYYAFVNKSMRRQIPSSAKDVAKANAIVSRNLAKTQHSNGRDMATNQGRTRAKTFGDVRSSPLTATLPDLPQQTPPSVRQQQTLFHPDIYLKPSTRKKYFCQLIDSYMNKKMIDTSTVKRKINKNISLNNRYEIVHEEGTPGYLNSQTNSPVRIEKQKRAMTAGSRRTVTQNVKIKLLPTTQGDLDDIGYANSKGKLTIDRYHTEDSDEVRAPNPMRYNKNYNKMQMLKTFMKGNKGRLRNFEAGEKEKAQADVFNSLSSQSDSLELDQTPNKEFRDSEYSKKGLKSAQKVSIDSKSRLKPISQLSNSNNFSTKSKSHKLINLREKPSTLAQTLNLDITALEQEINDRIKLTNLRYREKEWVLDYLHDYALYSVFYLSCLGDVSGEKIRVKKFKESRQAEKIMNTVDKIREAGVSHLWTLLPKTSSKQSSHLYLSPSTKPLRQQLFNFIPSQPQNPQTPLYTVQPTILYSALFHNNCEQFRDIIISVAQDLLKMKGTLINNKISLDNLYRLGEKAIKLGDWGSAAVNRSIWVAGKLVTFRDQPVLRVDFGELEEYGEIGSKWLLNPESLPPEVIQSLIAGSYNQVWQISPCPQMWCLGILIFQLLTCIPVWMPNPCLLKHNLPKPGCFHDRQKRLPQILASQQKIPNLISKWIRDERGSALYQQVHPQLINIMKGALQLNPKLRPLPDEVIKRLSAIL